MTMAPKPYVSVAAAFVLAGCVSQPSDSGAEAQYRAFVADAGVAEIIANRCPGRSLRQPFETMFGSYQAQMRNAGYTQTQVTEAVQAVSTPEAAALIVGGLQSAGLPRGDVAALCAYGEAQVAQGTRIGGFLR